MSKMKQALQTYAIDLLLTIRENIKEAYTPVETNYRSTDELVMLVKELRDGQVCYYEVIIRPQPHMRE